MGNEDLQESLEECPSVARRARSDFCVNMEGGLKVVAGIIGFSVAFTSVAYLTQGRNRFVEFETHPSDQVFRDHDGYRLRWTGEDNIDREVKYTEDIFYPNKVGNIEGMSPSVGDMFGHLRDNGRKKNILVIRDLDEGQRGFVNFLRYKRSCAFFGWDSHDYAEVHMPKKVPIEPGNEAYGRKKSHITHNPMHEVE